MACQWRVLIEEDKDNLLQFTKVFPAKFLWLPICQSLPHHHFALYGISCNMGTHDLRDMYVLRPAALSLWAYRYVNLSCPCYNF